MFVSSSYFWILCRTITLLWEKKSSHKIKFEPTLLLLGNRKYPGIYMCYIYITYVWICICYMCYICNVIILFLIRSLLVSFVWHLHCAFSNVSSNCLHEKRQSHICYCLTFLHCPFFKCLFKSPAQEEAYWLHLFYFSSLCIFKCVFKLPAREEATSHWLHLFDFSPLCVFKCLLKVNAWVDA